MWGINFPTKRLVCKWNKKRPPKSPLTSLNPEKAAFSSAFKIPQLIRYFDATRFISRSNLLLSIAFSIDHIAITS